MHWGFKKIPFTLYTFVLAKILQNGAKFIQKLTSGFKNHKKEFGQLQTGSGKFKKLKSDGLFLSKKYIPSTKTLYTGIYLTLLSTTCAKIHQITYVIFETISHFSRHNSIAFFSSHITCFLQKQPIKVQIFRYPTAQVKVHQIPYAISQTKSQFFFQSLDLFTVS